MIDPRPWQGLPPDLLHELPLIVDDHRVWFDPDGAPEFGDAVKRAATNALLGDFAEE